MEFLKRIAGFVGLIIFLTPCIIAGIYAGRLNTASTLAGWGVGIGVAIIEGAIIVFAGHEKSQKNMMTAVGVVLLGALPSFYWIGAPLTALKPFKDHLPEYLTRASAANPDQEGAGAYQPIKGKLIPLDMKAKNIDPVFFDLSADFRPKNPDEIGAIAALWWEERRIGNYGGKGGAYQEHCTIMILDKNTGTVLASRSFAGPMPPSTSRNGASQTGDKPYKEITEFLNSLPHS